MNGASVGGNPSTMDSLLSNDELLSILEEVAESDAPTLRAIEKKKVDSCRPRGPTVIPTDPYKELRFLVIDDQVPTQQSLKISIQAAGGFRVDTASSFIDASNKITRAMPDIVLCDYILGNGRTGQHLLEEMRRSSRLPDTTGWIMVTAERQYEQVLAVVEWAPDDYLIKPFSPAVLRKRMDRVVAKKHFFVKFYTHKHNQLYAEALNELERLAGAAEGGHYQYDILRAKAETLALAQRLDDALSSYNIIIQEHMAFPWALAGKARLLRKLHRTDEALSVVDDLLGASPTFFDAFDLKADLLCDQGKFDQAQQLLASTSDKTPRNFTRKRRLSSVARQAGDHKTAQTVMEDVLENDTCGGSVMPIRDRLEMARCALVGGNISAVVSCLGQIGSKQRDAMGQDDRIAFDLLLALSEGVDGEKRFDRIRNSLTHSTSLSMTVSLDAVKAALTFQDRQLADMIAERLLGGHEAKQAFHSLLVIYQGCGFEAHFRTLQRTIAAKKLVKA